MLLLTLGLYVLAELLAPFIFSLFFSNVGRKRGKMKRANSAEKNRPIIALHSRLWLVDSLTVYILLCDM